MEVSSDEWVCVVGAVFGDGGGGDEDGVCGYDVGDSVVGGSGGEWGGGCGGCAADSEAEVWVLGVEWDGVGWHGMGWHGMAWDGEGRV